MHTTDVHSFVAMDFHSLTLDQYEASEDFMENMLNRAQQLRDSDPQLSYYIEAFINERLQWTEYASGEEERDQLVNDAILSGFECTVKPITE